jgi:excisionase family DNA binding protein
MTSPVDPIARQCLDQVLGAWDARMPSPPEPVSPEVARIRRVLGTDRPAAWEVVPERKPRQGDGETGRQGDKETGRQGDRETRRQGDRETTSGVDPHVSLSPPLLVSPSPSAERLLPIEEAAAALSCTAETIRRQLRRGRLPGRKIGRVWRVDLAAIAAEARCA